jgi:hypothetical protein
MNATVMLAFPTAADKGSIWSSKNSKTTMKEHWVKYEEASVEKRERALETLASHEEIHRPAAVHHPHGVFIMYSHTLVTMKRNIFPGVMKVLVRGIMNSFVMVPNDIGTGLYLRHKANEMCNKMFEGKDPFPPLPKYIEVQPDGSQCCYSWLLPTMVLEEPAEVQVENNCSQVQTVHEKAKLCAKGQHSLVLTPSDGSSGCDICKRIDAAKGSTLGSCRQCGWKACDKCVDLRNTQLAWEPKLGDNVEDIDSHTARSALSAGKRRWNLLKNVHAAVKHKVTMRLDMEYPKDQVAEEQFKLHFIEDMATALEVDPACIEIKNIMAGSIIVQVEITGAEDLKSKLHAQVGDKSSRLYSGKVTKNAVPVEPSPEYVVSAPEVAKNPDGAYKHKYRLELTPDGRTQSRWVLMPKIHDHISQEDNVTSTVLPNNPMRDLENGALGGVRPPIGDAAYLASRLHAVEAERSFFRELVIQNRIRERIHTHTEEKTQKQLSGGIFGLADEQHAISGLKEPQGTSNAGTVPAYNATPMPRRKIIV